MQKAWLLRVVYPLFRLTVRCVTDRHGEAADGFGRAQDTRLRRYDAGGKVRAFHASN